MIQYCPTCGSKSIDMLYPKKEGRGHTGTYRCAACEFTWHIREAADRSDVGIKDKFTILKEDGAAVEAPCFVLILTDPAARVAALAYALASKNLVLSQQLRQLLRIIEKSPEDFPEPGSEGRLNAGVSCHDFEQASMAVLVIRKPEWGDDN